MRTNGRRSSRRMFVGAAVLLVGSTIGATQPTAAAPGKVTICHATGSASNPYVLITVSANAVREGRGHNRDGHQLGEDIIPPGEHDADGRNWDAAGQTTFEEECLVFLPNVLPPSR